MAEITYTDKETLNENQSIDDIYKCRAVDLNEIKSVVNTNAVFKPGETVTLVNASGDGAVYGGLITSGTKSIVCSITLPKSMENITSITCNATFSVRKVEGGYLYQNQVSSDITGASIILTKVGNNILRFRINTDEALSTINNSPCTVSFSKLTLIFN